MPAYSSDVLLQETQSTISELVKAFKLYWFYSENHPATLELIHAIYQKIRNILEEGPLKLNLSTNEVYLGAVLLDSKNKNIMEFCRHLNKRRIYSLTMLPELAEGEIFKLVGILAMDPKQIRRLGGVRKQLLDSTIIHVDITEYYYEQVEIEGNTTNSTENFNPLLTMTEEDLKKIQAYLLGETDDLNKGVEELFKEILLNPIRITELLNQTIAKDNNIQKPSEVVYNLQKYHFRICQWLNRLVPKEENLFVRKVATGLLNQRPEVGIDILTCRELLTLKQKKCIYLIADSISDEELLELITNNLSKDETPEETHPLIIKLPIDATRIVRLTQKYVALIEDKKRVDQDQREKMSLQGKFADYDNSKILPEVLGAILEIFESDLTITIHQDITGIIEKSIMELVLIRKYDLILDILYTLDRISNDADKFPVEIHNIINSLRPKLVSDPVIQGLISDLESASTQDEEKLISILSLLVPTVVGQIVTIFSSTTRFILRRPLSRVLIRIGDKGIPELANHILSNPEDVSKELISILGQIGSSKALEELKIIYQQIDIDLRVHVIMVLSEYKTQETREWLLHVIHSESNVTVQIACLEGFRKIGDSQSIDVLKEYALRLFMKKDSERNLQNRAIQLLGKLNVITVVPDLIKIFNQSRWIPSKKRDQMRIVIAQTLWKMEDDNAKATVENGCHDFRGSVRRMCRSLVMQADKTISR